MIKNLNWWIQNQNMNYFNQNIEDYNSIMICKLKNMNIWNRIICILSILRSTLKKFMQCCLKNLGYLTKKINLNIINLNLIELNKILRFLKRKSIQ